MKNSFKKRIDYFFQVIFEDIYFLSNSVCHPDIMHVTSFGYMCEISFI